jgi:Zn-dependent peptidase ImmA (M78 family)
MNMTPEICAMYQQPEMAEEWKQRMKSQVAPWIEKKGKSYWEFVRFFLYREGLLHYLSRKDFALWLTTECPDALAESDTQSSLMEIMKKFDERLRKGIRKRTNKEREQQREDIEFQFDLLPDAHVCRALYRELEGLCSHPLVAAPPTEVQQLEESLRRFVEHQAGIHGLAKVFNHPEYCGYRPELSIEYYMNEELAEKRDATFTQIYELTDEPLTRDTVVNLAGRYMTRDFTKLVIVTTHGIDNATRLAASARKVSILRIDPRREISANDFMLSHHVGDSERERHDREVMAGREPMTTPFVIMDEFGVTTSLPDFLNNQGVPVRPGCCLKAPHLNFDDIETRAKSLVQEKVDKFIQMMKITQNLQYFDADPFQLAAEFGYQVDRNWHEDSVERGHVNFKGHRIVLNFPPNSDEHRVRFTLAHELGHVILHSSLNIDSFGDTEESISGDRIVLNEERKWLERQANHFASCLLMPREVITPLYCSYCEQRFGNSGFKLTINHYDHQKEKLFMSIAEPLSILMGVSMEAFGIRLEKLGLAQREKRSDEPHGLKTLDQVLPCAIRQMIE